MFHGKYTSFHTKTHKLSVNKQAVTEGVTLPWNQFTKRGRYLQSPVVINIITDGDVDM